MQYEPYCEFKLAMVEDLPTASEFSTEYLSMETDPDSPSIDSVLEILFSSNDSEIPSFYFDIWLKRCRSVRGFIVVCLLLLFVTILDKYGFRKTKMLREPPMPVISLLPFAKRFVYINSTLAK
ncbi:hypothetical protein I79_020593 [Cricetulus griseus]|uniref:Uncharacterized protein n=1 Tax=Cricetulus griseus TaxID=10029 RepID=G3IAH0_CRIGR|nr:hypothetical protein I79_020593 [Cricetulus griseus]